MIILDLYNSYSQFIMMEEEEFDEFEEATYSHPPSAPQKQPATVPEGGAAMAGLQLLSEGHEPDAIGESLWHSGGLEGSGGLQKESPRAEEAMWGQLAKGGSVHESTEPPLKIDFTRTYSLGPQTNTAAAQDLFDLNFAHPPQPASLHFLDPPTTHIAPNLASSASPALHTDFLFDFAPAPVSAQLPSLSQPLPEIQSEPYPQQTQKINVGSNLYSGLDLNGADDFGMLTAMTETPTVGAQHELKVEAAQGTGLLDDGNHQLQFGSYPQQIIEVDPIAQFASSEGKVEHQEALWTDSAPVVPSAHYSGYDQTEPEIVEEEEGGAERKESEQFYFHEATQPHPHLPEDPEPRKQSDQFVFETTQHPLQTHSDSVQDQFDPFSEPQKSVLPPTLQENHIQTLPQEEVSQPVEYPFEQQEAHEAQEAQEAKEEEEDEFGDFEETTAVQESAQDMASNGVPQQDNTVQINEEYRNSQESAFYAGRQKELQEFVDSLPDYSFLFAKAFLS